ncbi:restriction endonuclease [Spirosoma jeollabukense]
MTGEAFVWIWFLCGSVGYFIFKQKEIPADYYNRQPQDKDIWTIGFMFAINVLGGVLTLYLSIKESDAPEKIKIQEEYERKLEEEAKQKEKREQRILYEKELSELRVDALKRIAWSRYHSTSGYYGHVDNMTGKEFELFVALLYSHMGYKVEQISTGTDQGVDIVLTDDGGIRFAIQTKRWSKTVGNSAVQEVLGGKRYQRCKYAIVVTNSYFSRQAVELARRSGVKLVDGQQLTELCNKHFPIVNPKYIESEYLKIERLAMKCLGKVDESYIKNFIGSSQELNRKKIQIEAKYQDVI